MIELKRRPDWRSRLSTFMESVRNERLVYGVHDCVVGLAAGAVEAMTGVDLAADVRGAYSGEARALAQIRQRGFADIAELTAAYLPEIHVGRATSGDLAAVPRPGPFGFALGVVSGDRIMVIDDSGRGLGSVDLLAATRAYKVG